MVFDEKVIPAINESENTAEQFNNIPIKVEKVNETDTAATGKFIFFISISDLFDSNNKIKLEIDVKNNNLILNSDLNLSKCNNF